MEVKKQQLELDMKQQTDSKSGKEYINAVYYHPAYLTYMQSTSREMLGLDEAQAGIARININNLRYADDTTLMAESEEELKSLLMKVKEESEKVEWKLNIQKTKIIAFGPISSWQIDGETMETVTDFIFLGSKITADGDCSHEIKRRLFLERKAVTNLAAAAAAAKSLQSCLTLCDPIDGSPPGSPVPGILQARTLEWVAISFSKAWKWKVKVKSLSHV